MKYYGLFLLLAVLVLRTCYTLRIGGLGGRLLAAAAVLAGLAGAAAYLEGLKREIIAALKDSPAQQES